MFRLSRYFSVASLIGMISIVIVLTLFYRHQAMDSLMEQQTRANVDLTKSFSNAVWGRFKEFVEKSESWTVEEIRSRPELEKLRLITLAQMKNMNVVKVKVYNLSGITVFSTEPSQIGMNKAKSAGSAGFLKARSGTVASEIAFKNQFQAFEQVIVDRNLIATYLPVRESEAGTVKAVFEIYTDVTPLVKKIESTQIEIVAGVSLALTLLYFFLYMIVRRADKIIKNQELQQRESEEHIRYQAFHDSLTGLPNRESFVQYIGKAIHRVRRNDKNGALLFLDLDGFKLINDSMGHDVGDQLLKAAATRISSCLRETDMAFRLSGDEFLVVMENLDKNESAGLMAQRILDTMSLPVSLKSREVIVQVSIGIAIIRGEEISAGDLLRQADSAMYTAKKKGPNHYSFYTDQQLSAELNKSSFEQEVRSAIQKRELCLFFQPVVDAKTKRIVAVEALLRWQHPSYGLLLPERFLPVMDELGMTSQVGNWVLIQACQYMKSWLDSGCLPVRLCVNVSAKHFKDGSFISHVENALAKTGLEASRLVLELTEDMFRDRPEFSIEQLHRLKRLGVSLSIDHFGLGFSSVENLKSYPIDSLKIDRTLTSKVGENAKDTALLASMTVLANILDLELTAVGVEDRRQLKFFNRRGCFNIQGNLISPPRSAMAMEDLLI